MGHHAFSDERVNGCRVSRQRRVTMLEWVSLVFSCNLDVRYLVVAGILLHMFKS